ncbi:MAG: diaminopropionate ammonia-lyase [Synergistaceae bacterium]|jgi:diaminopropionate ammonia-lyase|nr:diaminopropionate ammonia-lyase [Synergistaceae bacterium]
MITGERVLWTSNEGTKFFKKTGETGVSLSRFGRASIESVRKFHSTIPGYKPTPLRNLDGMAKTLNLGAIYVKDESFRFGLNAFKSLGCSYAVAKLLASRMGLESEDISYETISGAEAGKALGSVTFAAVTDGNHGRGVAWIARMLGHKAEIFMPKGSSESRISAIRAEGASVTVRGMNYDESVEMTAREAGERGWTVIQDTAWEGYTDIPFWTMQGYCTMALEASEEIIRLTGGDLPTHVFVQAGVGSMAASVQGFFRACFPQNPPKIVVVEASKADCFYKSAVGGQGAPRVVSGDLDTIMAGLACGSPNFAAWEILRDYASLFASCPDYVTAHGMRALGCPERGDHRVISGESGAVTMGLLSLIMRDSRLSAMRITLGLNDKSRVLLFSTEGDTDPEKYRSITWDGEFPTYDLSVYSKP